MIATNPVLYPTVMLTAILEKVLYVGTIIALALRGQLHPVQAAAIVVPDGLLAVLFVGAFFKTPAPDVSS